MLCCVSRGIPLSPDVLIGGGSGVVGGGSARVNSGVISRGVHLVALAACLLACIAAGCCWMLLDAAGCCWMLLLLDQFLLREFSGLTIFY
jgi:hypothetical protein